MLWGSCRANRHDLRGHQQVLSLPWSFKLICLGRATDPAILYFGVYPFTHLFGTTPVAVRYLIPGGAFSIENGTFGDNWCLHNRLKKPLHTERVASIGYAASVPDVHLCGSVGKGAGTVLLVTARNVGNDSKKPLRHA